MARHGTTWHDMARHGTTWHDGKNKQQLRNDMQSSQRYTELHFLTTQKFERHACRSDRRDLMQQILAGKTSAD